MQSILRSFSTRTVLATIAVLVAVGAVVVIVLGSGSDATVPIDAVAEASADPSESPDTDAGQSADDLEAPQEHCTDITLAVNQLAQAGSGDTSIADGIAALTRVRDAGTEVDAELTTLIESYTSIADGDLTLLGEPDHAQAVTQAAGRVTAELAERCPAAFDAVDQA